MPAALGAAGADVRVHVEHFTQGTPDVDWLRAIRGHGWVVLTKDTNMRRRPLEIAALMEAGLRVFAVTAGKCPNSGGGLFENRLEQITRLALYDFEKLADFLLAATSLVKCAHDVFVREQISHWNRHVMRSAPFSPQIGTLLFGFVGVIERADFIDEAVVPNHSHSPSVQG